MTEGEFGIIDGLFSPLATTPGAFGLKDDVALLHAQGLVLTKDVIVEGVHFRAEDPLDLVARKLLRVNLSDLAAKGAKPLGYLLGCTWRRDQQSRDIARFVAGLKEDQETFRITLLGGDTTVHRDSSAPAVFSATLIGTPPPAGVILRQGARIGDDVYVTGSIGDGFLGLAALREPAAFAVEAARYLADRYLLPTPRLAMGAALASFASAALDVSDGLLADAGRLVDANPGTIGIRLFAEATPLSAAGADWVARAPDRRKALASLAAGGDDYEILFTAAPSMRRSVEMAAAAARTPAARIGEVTRSGGVVFIDSAGAPIDAPQRGYDHFA